MSLIHKKYIPLYIPSSGFWRPAVESASFCELDHSCVMVVSKWSHIQNGSCEVSQSRQPKALGSLQNFILSSSIQYISYRNKFGIDFGSRRFWLTSHDLQNALLYQGHHFDSIRNGSHWISWRVFSEDPLKFSHPGNVNFIQIHKCWGAGRKKVTHIEANSLSRTFVVRSVNCSGTNVFSLGLFWSS